MSTERAATREEGRDPQYGYPADHLEPDGKYDAAFDQHTYGKTRDRDGAFFRTHGAGVGPDGEPELSRRWRLRSMKPEDRTYTEEQLARVVALIDPDGRWSDDLNSG